MRLNKLRVGATMSMEIARDDHGYTLTPVARVGQVVTKRYKGRRVRSEEDVWVAWETMGQDNLAKLGAEKIKK